MLLPFFVDFLWRLFCCINISPFPAVLLLPGSIDQCGWPHPGQEVKTLRDWDVVLIFFSTLHLTMAKHNWDLEYGLGNDAVRQWKFYFVLLSHKRKSPVPCVCLCKLNIYKKDSQAGSSICTSEFKFRRRALHRATSSSPPCCPWWIALSPAYPSGRIPM